MVARPHGKSAGLGGRPGGGWRLAGTSAGFRPRFRVGVLAIASAALAAAGAATSAQAKRIQQAPSRGSLGRRLTLDEVLNNMRMRANTLFDKLDFNSNGYIDVVELQVLGRSPSMFVEPCSVPVLPYLLKGRHYQPPAERLHDNAW